MSITHSMPMTNRMSRSRGLRAASRSGQHHVQSASSHASQLQTSSSLFLLWSCEEVDTAYSLQLVFFSIRTPPFFFLAISFLFASVLFLYLWKIVNKMAGHGEESCKYYALFTSLHSVTYTRH